MVWGTRQGQINLPLTQDATGLLNSEHLFQTSFRIRILYIFLVAFKFTKAYRNKAIVQLK